MPLCRRCRAAVVGIGVGTGSAGFKKRWNSLPGAPMMNDSGEAVESIVISHIGTGAGTGSATESKTLEFAPGSSNGERLPVDIGCQRRTWPLTLEVNSALGR